MSHGFINTPETFWKRVAISSDQDACWLWLGSKSGGARGGYGQLSWKGKQSYAHRIALSLFSGEEPRGRLACHTCDNHGCCNPKHLFWGTYADNMHDMWDKGRAKNPRGEYNGSAMLTWEKVIEIRARYAQGDVSTRKLSKLYGISYHSIWQVVTNKTWKEANGYTNRHI